MRTTGLHWHRAALIVGVILGGVIVARAFGFTAYLRFENLSRLAEAIEGHGVLGPVIFISAYALGVVFFVPALPMTLLGGLAFGPVRGAAYVWVAATIGAALAFLVARYGLRGLVERWVARNARLTRMDEAVARDGWRIVMITRLVPLFPFNLQNYAYGVTRIGFWAYVTTSAVCMIPATVAYTFAAGALSGGGGDLRRTVGYLAVAGILSRSNRRSKFRESLHLCPRERARIEPRCRSRRACGHVSHDGILAVKMPNKAPEPTTMAVTPRAISRISK